MVRTVKIDEKFSKTFDRLFKYISKAGDEVTLESNSEGYDLYFDYGQFFESGYGRNIPIPDMFVSFIEDLYEEYYNDYISDYSYSNYEGSHYHNVIFTFFTNEKVIQIRIQVREETTEAHSDTRQISLYVEEELDVINEFMSQNNTEIFTVEFSGGGDDGYLEDYGHTLDNRRILIPDSLSDILNNFLSDSFGGWENNDGGRGEIIIDTQNNEIRINILYSDAEYQDTGLRLNITQ